MDIIHLIILSDEKVGAAHPTKSEKLAGDIKDE